MMMTTTMMMMMIAGVQFVLTSTRVIVSLIENNHIISPKREKLRKKLTS